MPIQIFLGRPLTTPFWYSHNCRYSLIFDITILKYKLGISRSQLTVMGGATVILGHVFLSGFTIPVDHVGP